MTRPPLPASAVEAIDFDAGALDRRLGVVIPAPGARRAFVAALTGYTRHGAHGARSASHVAYPGGGEVWVLSAHPDELRGLDLDGLWVPRGGTDAERTWWQIALSARGGELHEYTPTG